MVNTTVSDVSLVFISLTLNPIREIILHDQSMCVHSSTRFLRSKSCDLPWSSHQMFLKLQSHPRVSQVWVHRWVVIFVILRSIPECFFSPEHFTLHRLPPRAVIFQKVSPGQHAWSCPAGQTEEDASSSFDPSVTSSNIVSFMASEESRATLRLVTATLRTKVPTVHSVTLVQSDILGDPAEGHEWNNRARCIVFPTIALMDNYPPNVLSENAKAPRCGLWQACLRQQHHWRSVYLGFSFTAEDVSEECSAQRPDDPTCSVECEGCNGSS